jgi:hypothetical protein
MKSLQGYGAAKWVKSTPWVQAELLRMSGYEGGPCPAGHPGTSRWHHWLPDEAGTPHWWMDAAGACPGAQMALLWPEVSYWLWVTLPNQMVKGEVWVGVYGAEGHELPTQIQNHSDQTRPDLGMKIMGTMTLWTVPWEPERAHLKLDLQVKWS